MQSNPEAQLPKKKTWRRWLIISALIFLFVNGAGLLAGNIVYKETSVLHSRMKAQCTSQQRTLEIGKTEKHWQDIGIESGFGYLLQGTFIPNPKATDKTLIFLHGFTEDRLAGLSYLGIYLNAGFNLLLVDSRAHGESGGNSVTWGNYEKYDLDRWVDWVSQRYPAGKIGVHGVSMGAATALMHAELNEYNKRVDFYIAESAYSDFETLLELLMKQRLNLPRTVLPELLLQYANLAAYIDSRFTFHQASPVRAVRNVTTPILYIHGEADEVVPAYMSLELYNATKGPRQIYTFPHVGHASAVFGDWSQYSRVIQNFTRSVEQHS